MTVTVIVSTGESLADGSPVELAVAELIVTEVGMGVVDELPSSSSSSPSSQSLSSSGSFASVELSFPVTPP